MISPVNIKLLSPSLIFRIAKELPNNKAPGLDKISTSMINSSHKIYVQLFYIFKESIRKYYFPNIWKNALILAFPKPSKTSLANYRPISLLRILSKMLEKFIHVQLEYHLTDNNIIINEQFGFKPRHSTVQQLLRITEHFTLEINKKRSSAMILLDLKKKHSVGITIFCTSLI